MGIVDLLLHPVRLRIVHGLFGGRELTTTQLGARMPDVSKVTVYRQVAMLVEGGFMEVAGEQRVRGAVERHPGALRAWGRSAGLRCPDVALSR